MLNITFKTIYIWDGYEMVILIFYISDFQIYGIVNINMLTSVREYNIVILE